MFKLRLFQARPSGGRSAATLGAHGRPAYVLIGALVLVNLLALIAYQSYVGGDFPFQDEWGYVNRLQQLPQTGFTHYLFDKYQTYYMPVFMLVWYVFYRLAHLDIMTIRYTGAVISAGVSLILCLMLRGKSLRLSTPAWLAIACGPFLVCSFNHWATLNQSIESVMEPLLFGIVLLTSWAVERTLLRKSALFWVALCALGGLTASGIYANGLALLPAVVAGRFLVYRRIDLPLVLLGGVAVILPISYVSAGRGLEHAGVAAGFTFGDAFEAVKIWLGLTGNTLFTPGLESARNFTRVLGAGMLFAQGVALMHVLRLPSERRLRFMVPTVLTIYNLLVFAEILVARFHYPDVAFAPRYSIHMLGGAVSLLFWIVTLADSVPWSRWLTAGTLALVVTGFVAADIQMLARVQYLHHSFAEARVTLMSLQGQPTPEQLRDMFVGEPLSTVVYPGRKFLEENRLAMYSGRPASKQH